MAEKPNLSATILAALESEGLPVDDRPIVWKLQDLALDFKGAAGASGDTYQRAVAVVLAALARLPLCPNDPALGELAAVAERFLKRNPEARPFMPTAADGSDLLLEMLRRVHADGLTNGQIALRVIGAAPTARPGLPAIAKHDELPPDERRAYAAELMGSLEKALLKVEKKCLDADDWCEAALRAVLRVLGDPTADNALKHKFRPEPKK